MRAPLQATLTLGLPSICLEITPQLLSLKNWALSIKEKALGEDHKKTADCYRDMGII